MIAPVSDCSFMYYVNPGLKGYYNTAGGFQPDYVVFGNGAEGGQNDVGLVKNVQSNVYWSGTTYTPAPADYYAWDFYTYGGSQNYSRLDREFYAWAVRDGDVAVPEPEPIPEPEI